MPAQLEEVLVASLGVGESNAIYNLRVRRIATEATIKEELRQIDAIFKMEKKAARPEVIVMQLGQEIMKEDKRKFGFLLH